MNNDILGLIKAIVVGLALGAFYCAVLWYAVCELRTAKRPIVWLFGTAFLRLGVVLAGFYWIMDERWLRLVLALAGFIVARLMFQLWLGSAGTKQPANP